MENLVYIHLASSHGENEDANKRANSEDVKVFQRVNWRNVSTRTWVPLLSLVLTVSSVGIATKAMAEMTQGSKGQEVTELQAKLQKLGYFDRRPTGHFGPLTKKAVIRFQQDEGITANGVVETTTLTALQNKFQDNTTEPQTTLEPETENTQNTQETAIDPSTQPTLRRGATGSSVKALQQLLTDAGAYSGAIDGKFDLQTSIAVRQFQRSSRLMVDGIVGRNTWTALAKGGTTQVADPTFNNSPFTNESITNSSDEPLSNRRTVIQASLKKGDRGQEVKSLQQRLQALGYYRGNTTGNFGPLTKEAVTRFQRQTGLTANGIVDSSTKAALLTPPRIRNFSVSYIQTKLKERGFYQGPVNGSFNDETKAALEAAQKAYGVGENDILIQP